MRAAIEAGDIGQIRHELTRHVHFRVPEPVPARTGSGADQGHETLVWDIHVSGVNLGGRGRGRGTSGPAAACGDL
jgi:hypothetical protein